VHGEREALSLDATVLRADEFLREKDNQLHEHAKAMQRNAELAIEKQEELIRCLANISVVLGKDLMVGTPGGPPDMDSNTAMPEGRRSGRARTMHPNTCDGADGI
jgi:hypothetical protein